MCLFFRFDGFTPSASPFNHHNVSYKLCLSVTYICNFLKFNFWNFSILSPCRLFDWHRWIFVYAIEADPAFTAFNWLEFFKNFFFAVTYGLDGLPECHELCLAYLSILIHINLVEELLSRDFTKSILPVVDGFALVNRFATIDIKAAKHLNYLSLAFRRQFL